MQSLHLPHTCLVGGKAASVRQPHFFFLVTFTRHPLLVRRVQLPRHFLTLRAHSHTLPGRLCVEQGRPAGQCVERPLLREAAQLEVVDRRWQQQQQREVVERHTWHAVVPGANQLGRTGANGRRAPTVPALLVAIGRRGSSRARVPHQCWPPSLDFRRARGTVRLARLRPA